MLSIAKITSSIISIDLLIFIANKNQSEDYIMQFLELDKKTYIENILRRLGIALAALPSSVYIDLSAIYIDSDPHETNNILFLFTFF